VARVKDIPPSNNPVNADAVQAARCLHGAGYRNRVCRAWHRTIGVKVPEPGKGGAEG